MRNVIARIVEFFTGVNEWKWIYNKILEFWILGRKIGFNWAYLDVMSVCRRLWFFFVIQLMVALSFLLFEQGADVLLTLIEDYSAGRKTPFFVLIAATLFWSIVSEFGARMLVLLNDSDNLNISEDRKKFRKMVQKAMPAFMVVFPFIIFILALSKTYTFHYFKGTDMILDFVCIILMLLLAKSIIIRYYFSEKRRTGKYQAGENEFQRKRFSELGNILIVESGIIQNYQEINQSEGSGLKIIKSKSVDYVKISLRKYYGILYRRLILYCSIVCVCFIVLGLLQFQFLYYNIGTAALITLGFSCWLVTFYSIKIFQLVEPFEGKWSFLNLPYSSIALFLLLFCSYINYDHPIQHHDSANSPRSNIGPKVFAHLWYDKHKDLLKLEAFDTTILTSSGTIERRLTKVPFFLVCAEGGALRTGSYTSMLLSAIEDSIPGFHRTILAYSTVSGGTFGANLFNAMVHYSPEESGSYLHKNEEFYKSTDFLAPLAGKLFFGDFINYFWPKHLESCDRQIALENSWTQGYSDYISDNEFNPFYHDFYVVNKSDGSMPAVLINSAVSETGRRAIISNVQLDSNYFHDVTDFNTYYQPSISNSTAIGLSARFPLVSPGGMMSLHDNSRIHLIDGGYFENRGNTTMREFLKSLEFQPATDSIVFVPYVIQTIFNRKSLESNGGIRFLNELSEILNGIYNVRSGRTTYASIEMQEQIRAMGGSYIELPVTNNSKEIPNNWSLSRRAVNSAHDTIVSLLYTRNAEGDSLWRMVRRVM